MSAKRTIVLIGTLFVVAVAGLAAYAALTRWLPRKVGAALTERFGEHVTIGEVAYVFPLGVEVRDVVFVKRPESFVSAEAARMRVKLRPSALLLLRFDGRLLREITTEEYTIHLYPLRLRRPRLASPAELGAAGAGGVVLPPPAGDFPEPPPPPEPPPAINEAAKPIAKKAPRPASREFDFTFRASGGRIIFRGEKYDTLIFRDVACEGSLSDQDFAGALQARTPDEKSFEISAEHSFATKAGAASYRFEAVEAIHLLSWAGKPGYLLEAEGVLTLEGKVRWAQGKVDHTATGGLSRGRLLLAPDNVQIELTDVTLQFGLHNADFTIEEGSCRAAEARWHFGGRASKLALDVTFRSENMTLQNLVDMIVGGEVRVSYAGVGFAELRIFGTPRDPQFYLHVERTDR
jgi:hypothetical protein